jgi:mevalonate pyrophosphate decarboxylase
VPGINDMSRRVMDVVHRFNDFCREVKAAYTFEAGPDPVLFFMERYESHKGPKGPHKGPEGPYN